MKEPPTGVGGILDPTYIPCRLSMKAPPTGVGGILDPTYIPSRLSMKEPPTESVGYWARPTFPVGRV